MKELYERALKAFTDKMKQLSNSQDKISQYANCTSRSNVSEAIEQIDRIISTLEYCERINSHAEDTVKMMFDNMMSIRKDAT